MEASKKKVLIIGSAVVIGGGLLWWYLRRKAAAASAASPMAPTTPGASVSTTPARAAGSLYKYSPDIDAALNRRTPEEKTKYEALLASANQAQFQMLDSIAHSWNNNIALTSDQATFWGTYGVF